MDNTTEYDEVFQFLSEKIRDDLHIHLVAESRAEIAEDDRKAAERDLSRVIQRYHLHSAHVIRHKQR